MAQVIGGLRIGGAERQFVNLLNALKCEYRAAMFIGAPPAEQSFHSDLAPGIEQHFIRVRRRNVFRGVLQLAAFFRRARINVVHTHMYGANLYGSLAAWVARVPVIVTTEHGENPWKGPWHRWVEREVVSRIVDFRYCVSPRIADLRRHKDGVSQEKLGLIANGVTLPEIVESRSGRGSLVIGSVGRFIGAKNFQGLLQAASLLRSRGREFELCIVGDGPESDAIRRCVSDLGLEGIVRLPGQVTNVDQWYREFDIFVSSSIREGQPMALMEAMAFGLPVVATDVGASAITVGDNTGGLIVEPGNTAMLAERLEHLLNDSALRRSLGESARARIEREFSIDAVAAKLTRDYLEILGKKHAMAAGRS